jgi:hypothetical protein
VAKEATVPKLGKMARLALPAPVPVDCIIEDPVDPQVADAILAGAESLLATPDAVTSAAVSSLFSGETTRVKAERSCSHLYLAIIQ